ncbi:hypothetical protein [Nitrosopumilus sp.]|uniref:hypothetical protein n=1 Tax=Nitrosopumilus sp. TaxID=2024843 RepID=UPI003D146F3A
MAEATTHEDLLALHGDEWSDLFLKYYYSNDEAENYRARCIQGLITGNTMDF